VVFHRQLCAMGAMGIVFGSACVGQFGDVELPDVPDTGRLDQVVSSLALSAFASKERCSGCHPRQVEEWSESAHSHAMLDPVFQALIARAGVEAPEQRAFCTSCHTNIGAATGALDADYSFATLDPVVMEGVTCESCHRITDVFRSSNAGHTLDPFAPMQGSVYAGSSSPGHETERSSVLSSAELCGSCHDVQSGSVQLERPYAEWLTAPARDQGKQCVDCHMSPAYGRSAERFGLDERPVRSHTFRGPGALSSLGDRPEAQAREIAFEVARQLSDAVSVELVAPAAALSGTQFALRVVIRSNVSGHRFPTGSSFFRELWLELQVRDSRGLLVYASGTASAREASPLHDLWLSARLLDDTGAPTLWPWRAASLENHALDPLEERRVDLNIDVPSSAVGPLRAEAKLLFQSFPSPLLEDLGLDPELARRLEIATATALIALPSGS
jgi:hypothetical protein